MFSKCKVSSDCISNVYSQQFPLVDVYGAAIRRLRTKKEVLKLQQETLVIQLNDALAQLQTLKEEQAPFNTSQMFFFFELSSICKGLLVSQYCENLKAIRLLSATTNTVFKGNV